MRQVDLPPSIPAIFSGSMERYAMKRFSKRKMTQCSREYDSRKQPRCDIAKSVVRDRIDGMTSRYPIYLIDDDDTVREGLSLLFRASDMAVRTFVDANSFLEKVDRNKPGFLLVDLKMPQVNGLELHQQLVARGIRWPLVILTGHGDVAACRAAFQVGVMDFLSKPVDADTLFATIHAMERLLDTVLERQQDEALLATLTPRESEILNMICRGFDTKGIANALGISPRTVDAHRVNISTKLGTTSVVEFVRMTMGG